MTTDWLQQRTVQGPLRGLCRRYVFGVLHEKVIFGHINNKRAPSRSLWEAKLVRAQSVV